MKLSKKVIVFLSLTVLTSVLVFYFLETRHPYVGASNQQLSPDNLPTSASNYLKKLRTAPRLDPVFSTGKDYIYFSAAKDGRFQTFDYSLKTSLISRWPNQKSSRDYFYPTFFNGNHISVYDEIGNQRFKLAGISLQTLPHKPGRLRVIHTTNYLLLIGNQKVECFTKDKRKCGERTFKGQYRGHDFSPDDRYFLLASTDGLSLWDLKFNAFFEISQLIQGEKGGPAFDWDNQNVYFTAIGADSFKQIFKLGFTSESKTLKFQKRPQLVFQSPHDKAQLKKQGSWLYFIENKSTQYILKRYHLKTTKVESLTNQGVTYRYRLRPTTNQIVATYADPTTPLSLVSIDLETKKHSLLYPKDRKGFHMGKLDYLKPKGLSPAWVFSPAKKQQGVILSIHGGPSICVSPRWDATKQFWLEMGFAVIAPNYPGSRGYGENYMRVSARKSLRDLDLWLTKIKKDYASQPIFVDGLSYGGTLAQHLLRRRQKEVDGLFLRSTRLLLPEKFVATLPPTLIHYGRNDALTSHQQIKQSLKQWKKLAQNPLYYREYKNEGHLIRESGALEDSLLSIGNFMQSALTRREQAFQTE